MFIYARIGQLASQLTRQEALYAFQPYFWRTIHQGSIERINFRSDHDQIFFCDRNELFDIFFQLIEERDRIIFSCDRDRNF